MANKENQVHISRLLFAVHSWVSFAYDNKVDKFHLHMAKDSLLYICVACTGALIGSIDSDTVAAGRVCVEPWTY